MTPLRTCAADWCSNLMLRRKAGHRFCASACRKRHRRSTPADHRLVTCERPGCCNLIRSTMTGHAYCAPRCWKAARRKDRPGTPEERTALNETQRGLCAICREPETAVHAVTGAPKDLAADHDHATGRVRGLLCQRCNTGIGLFRDRPDLLRSAIDYLEVG